jgi:hypothetical protein
MLVVFKLADFFFGWGAVSQQQFNQIRRQPSNPPNTRLSHSSNKNNAVQNATIIHACTASALWKVRP